MRYRSTNYVRVATFLIELPCKTELDLARSLSGAEPMHQVNMHEAKSQLSSLVEEVLAGGDVVIARAGKPLARLVAYEERQEPRTPGRWKGKVRVADDFDATPEEVIAAFEGGT